jgi:hypothetical protein
MREIVCLWMLLSSCAFGQTFTGPTNHYAGNAYNFTHGSSPIVIDTLNRGFDHFSDPAKNCVEFDLRGKGKKECWSWPESGSGLGWLAWPYRTNPKVAIASGKDLALQFVVHGSEFPSPIGCTTSTLRFFLPNGERVGGDGGEKEASSRGGVHLVDLPGAHTYWHA